MSNYKKLYDSLINLPNKLSHDKILKTLTNENLLKLYLKLKDNYSLSPSAIKLELEHYILSNKHFKCLQCNKEIVKFTKQNKRIEYCSKKCENTSKNEIQNNIDYFFNLHSNKKKYFPIIISYLMDNENIDISQYNLNKVEKPLLILSHENGTIYYIPDIFLQKENRLISIIDLNLFEKSKEKYLLIIKLCKEKKLKNKKYLINFFIMSNNQIINLI